jgi:hypothetical protein
MVNFNNLAVATQVLTALNSQVSQDDNWPCATEGDAVTTCLDQKEDHFCLPCIIGALWTIEEEMTCEQIEASEFCSDIQNCENNICSADCSAEWGAWGTCLEAWTAANVDPTETCPDLCGGQDVFQIA